ncbi:protein kinase domain-containing protein [Streptomyces noursei]|uniref:protein kinase domain-containing protein n=1 Tax=Streptomyces noursei TaxID=1971 RepID=UPI003827492C
MIAAAWNTGDLVDGRYRLTRVVGHGGMGVVHRARHLGWGVDLAVKSLLPAYFVKARDVENFVAEARRWVSLGLHPNVCSCYYVRVLDGIPRLFSEYVRGGSLREAIDGGSLYDGDEKKVHARILRIGSHMARGLEYAHRRGVLHCDVKPANVLLEGGADGIAKITDFGISESLAGVLEVAHLGAAGLGAGDLATPGGGGLTPAYASPEQKRREPLSPRSDVYSFAVTVREMFAAAAAQDVVTLAPGSDPTPVDAPGFDVAGAPPPVAELLERCLSDEPEQRPASMAEVAERFEALHAALAPDEPRLVPPKPAELRAAEHNNRALSHLDLGDRAAADAEFGKALEADPQHLDSAYNTGLLRWRRGEITDADLLAALDAASLHAGRPRHARALIAQTHLERGDVGGAREAVESALRDHPDDSEFLTVAQALTSGAAGNIAAARETPLPWYSPSDPDFPPFGQVRFTRDGSRLISGDEHGTTRLWDVSTGACLRSCEGGDGWSVRVDSSDGQHGLTYLQGGTIRVWDFGTGRSLRLLPPSGAGEVCAQQMSPDGGTAYAVTREGELLAWNLRRDAGTIRGALVRRLRFGGMGEFPRLECGPDGESLLCYHGGFEGRLQVLSSSYRDGVRVLADSCPRVRAMAWTPDGTFAVVADDREIGVWGVATGRRERRLSVQGAVTALSVDADARRVLTGDESGTVCLWDLVESRCVRTLTGPVTRGVVCDVRLSPDGRHAQAVGMDNTVRAWTVNAPSDYRATYQISRPRPAADLGSFGDTVRELVARADFALADFRHSAALGLLREARAIPGYERDAKVLELWRDLGRRLPWTGLRAAWTVRELPAWGPGDEGFVAGLSDDARYAVYGGMLAAGLRDLRDDRRLRELPPGAVAVGLSRDGRRVVCVRMNGTVGAWSVATGAEIATLHPVDAHVLTAAAVAADGNRVAVARKDHVLELWDVDRRCRVRALTGHTARVNALWITPDRRTLAAAGVDAVRIWDLDSGRRVLSVPTGEREYPRSVCVTTDRKFTLVGGDGTIGARIWNAAGECVQEFAGPHGRVICVRFSPDERFALVGDMDGAITVWSVASGAHVHTLATGQDGAVDMRLTPDGRYLLVGGFGGDARLWELDWELAAAQ